MQDASLSTVESARPASRIEAGRAAIDWMPTINLVCGFIAGAGTCLIRFLSFRGLPNDHYMHLAWAQQLLNGALPGRDFVEPGMPLTIGLSALAQLWWPGPFGEGILCITALGLASAATCFAIAAVLRSPLAGLVGTVVQAALFPRLYGYPKLLVPAVALLLMVRYVHARSTGTVFLLSAWTVAAFLLRHDLGVMTALAVACGVAVARVPWEVRRADLGRYIGFGLALVSPYLVYVQWTDGIVDNVRAALEFGKSDTHQLFIVSLPPRPSGGALVWNAPTAAWFLFWLTHALVATLLWRIFSERHSAYRSVLVATAVFLLLYRLVILRHPLLARIPDAAAVVVCAGAWCVESSTARLRAGLKHRIAAAVAGLMLASVALAAAWQIGGLAEEVKRMGITRGWTGIVHRAEQVIATARRPDWGAYWPAGEVPELVDYIRTCTPPGSHLLMTWSAPEFYIFTGRRFASGQFLFHPRSFSSARDQEAMLRRLEREHPPLALVNETRLAEFSSSFPAVHAWITDNYLPVGRTTIRGDEVIGIAVRRGLLARARWGSRSWPCGFNPGPDGGEDHSPPRVQPAAVQTS
jgi:hypothetical protein